MSKTLIEIVERSSSLYERQGEKYFLREIPSEPERQIAMERLQGWHGKGPKGNATFFSRRLAWDGLDESMAFNLFARPRFVGEELPAWCRLLEAVFACNRQLGSGMKPMRWAELDEPIAFEDVLLPFVEIAQRQMEEKAANLLAVLSFHARINLERALMQSLSVAAERTLYSDFVGWKAMPELAPTREASRPIYSSYVASMRGRGLEGLCLDYPVLARFLAQICCQWIDNTFEFLTALQEDRPRLISELFGGRDPGMVVQLVQGISDRHRGGKSVIEVRFSVGDACFFKPRDCRPEMAFNDLLVWLTERDDRHRLATYRVVDCAVHGWVEKVYAVPCEGEVSARRFFKRCGMLTAVLYALEASDCNFENILVAGDCPVLIDAETLLQPRPLDDQKGTWKALSVATEEMYYDSVLRLHILPQWTARPAGEKADMSGLGAGKGNRGSTRKKIWTEVNHDAMSFRWETVLIEDRAALRVAIDGELVATEDFLPEILDGFDSMYRLLIDLREELWAEGGPMHAFKDLPARVVVRNTFIYVGLRNHLSDPKLLRDGMDVSVALDYLAWMFADAEDKPKQWPLVEAECAAMFAVDVPCFHVQSSSTALQLGNGVSIPNYFREPAAHILNRRFFQMSEVDLDLQKRYIRSSFGHFEEVILISEPLSLQAGPGPGDDMGTAAFVEEALRLARAICAQAIRANDGTTSWITQTYNADSQFLEVKPIGLFLYDGIAGIALFLSALESILGTDEFEEVTTSVQGMLCDVGSSRMRYHLEREAVGAGLGTASLAYSLARIAVFRQDESLLDAAFTMARRITPAMIESDRRLDLIGGTAGCLLVLCALASIRTDPWLRDLAIVCGEHLLRMRSESPHQLMAWRTIRGNFLAGFSHGAAGIGCALARLYEWTSDPRFRVAAHQAVSYEEVLYSAEENNWPNLLLPRKSGGFDYWNSWCHGAPGIGLSRLLSRHALDPAASLPDLDRALAKAGQMELSNLDNLCCGNLGRIDLLIEAATALNRPEHLIRARGIAAAVVERAQREDDYVAGVRDGIYVPSFHQGMSGIGYQLLRLSQDKPMPSVMAWQ